jgi:hypothetical protein
MTMPEMEDTPHPIGRPLSSESDHESALDEVLLRARRQVLIFDRTLDTRWDRPQRVECLRRLCLASPRHLVRIALHDPESMVRNTPRLRALLESCAHVMSVHKTRAEARRAEDPLVIVDGRHFVHRFHADLPRGLLALDDPESAQSRMQRFEQIWAASDPGLSGTTLGL